MAIVTPKIKENTNWIKDLSSSSALLDKDFKVVEASNHLKRKFYLQQQDIVGKTIFDIFPSFSKDWKTKLDYVLEGLPNIQILDTVTTIDGGYKKVVWHLNAWKNIDGEIIGVIINAEDVTRLSELEHELQKTKNLLLEKGQIAKIGSWEYRIETEELILSSVTKKLFGIKSDSKISIKSLIGFSGTKENEEILKATLLDAMQKGTPWDRSLRFVSNENKSILVNTIGRPKFKNGQCTRIVGTVQILSDEKNTDERLKEDILNNIHDDYFEFSPAPLVLLDFYTGHILKVNEELDAQISNSKSDFEGKKFLEYVLRQDKATRLSLNKQLKEKGSFPKTDILFKDINGDENILSVKGNLINQGEHLLCNVENVTKKRRKLKSLVNKVKKEESHSEKLVNFTRLISHNLKGHATNFSAIVELLEDAENEREKAKILTVLKDSSVNLSDTINDLRAMVAIKKGAKAKKERVVINDCVFKAQQNLSGEIRKEKVKFINEITDTQKLTAYPVYLENILTICISNAIKYRKPNKSPLVIVSTEITKSHTILLIEDNGLGMDLNAKGEHLFQMGKTVGNNSEAKGMGLYLAKYQIELMDGKIEVESTPGHGSIFKIYFPHK